MRTLFAVVNCLNGKLLDIFRHEADAHTYRDMLGRQSGRRSDDFAVRAFQVPGGPEWVEYYALKQVAACF